MGAALAGRRSHGLDSGAGAGAVPELAAPGGAVSAAWVHPGAARLGGGPQPHPSVPPLPDGIPPVRRGTPSGPAGGWRHLLYAAGPHWDDGGYSAQTGDQQCVAQRGEGGEQSGEAGMLGGAGAGDLEAGAETCAPVLPPVEAAGRADAGPPDGHPVLLPMGDRNGGRRAGGSLRGGDRLYHPALCLPVRPGPAGSPGRALPARGVGGGEPAGRTAGGVLPGAPAGAGPGARPAP